LKADSSVMGRDRDLAQGVAVVADHFTRHQSA